MTETPDLSAPDLSDVSEDEADRQLGDPDAAQSDLDPDDGGTEESGQVDAAATDPSPDEPTDERSAL